jgi:hypothetical protein
VLIPRLDFSEEYGHENIRMQSFWQCGLERSLWHFGIMDSSSPTFDLVCGSKSVSLRKGLLVNNFHLFADNLDLLKVDQYVVKSRVSPHVFDEFIQYAQGDSITITKDNWFSFVLLSEEFVFGRLRSACGAFSAFSCLTRKGIAQRNVLVTELECSMPNATCPAVSWPDRRRET